MLASLCVLRGLCERRFGQRRVEARIGPDCRTFGFRLARAGCEQLGETSARRRRDRIAARRRVRAGLRRGRRRQGRRRWCRSGRRGERGGRRRRNGRARRRRVVLVAHEEHDAANHRRERDDTHDDDGRLLFRLRPLHSCVIGDNGRQRPEGRCRGWRRRVRRGWYDGRLGNHFGHAGRQGRRRFCNGSRERRRSHCGRGRKRRSRRRSGRHPDGRR